MDKATSRKLQIAKLVYFSAFEDGKITGIDALDYIEKLFGTEITEELWRQASTGVLLVSAPQVSWTEDGECVIRIPN